MKILNLAGLLEKNIITDKSFLKILFLCMITYYSIKIGIKVCKFW